MSEWFFLTQVPVPFEPLNEVVSGSKFLSTSSKKLGAHFDIPRCRNQAKTSKMNRFVNVMYSKITSSLYGTHYLLLGARVIPVAGLGDRARTQGELKVE